MRVFLALAAIILAGIPLLAYIWGTLNELLAGHVDGRRILLTLPLGLALLALLFVAGRLLSRLTAPASAVPPAAGAPREPEPVVTGTLFVTAVVAMVMFSLWVLAYTYLLHR